MIEFKNVNFAHENGRRVFSDFNFSFCTGEKIGIIGPNGSGKTTLFHLIMGLIKPQEGMISIFGNPRKEDSDFKEVRRKIGFIFQDSNDQLFSPTVEEDIAFGPLNLGKSHSEANEIVAKVCEDLEISHLKERITFHLSGGEKRLVALATVMAMEPEIYLFDEPTLGLDEHNREGLIEILLRSTIKSCLIISHDREFLKKTTDKIYELRQGRLSLSSIFA